MNEEKMKNNNRNLHKIRPYLVIVFVFVLCFIKIFSGTSKSQLQNLEDKDIFGYYLFDHRFNDTTNDEILRRIKIVENKTKAPVALMVLYPSAKADNEKQLLDSNIISSRWDPKYFRIQVVNDSIMQNHTQYTKHYYLFSDTIVPVVFEYDFIDNDKLFSRIILKQ